MNTIIIFLMFILAINNNGNIILKNLKEEKTTTGKPKKEERTTHPTTTNYDNSEVFDEDDVMHIEKQLDHIEKIKKKFLKRDKRILVKDIPNFFACLQEKSEIQDCVKIRSFRISNSNKYLCTDKHLGIEIHMVLKQDGEVFYNKTFEVFLTKHREIVYQQEKSDKCYIFRTISEATTILVMDQKGYVTDSSEVKETILKVLSEKQSYLRYLQIYFDYFSHEKNAYYNFDFGRDISWLTAVLGFIAARIYSAYNFANNLNNIIKNNKKKFKNNTEDNIKDDEDVKEEKSIRKCRGKKKAE